MLLYNVRFGRTQIEHSKKITRLSLLSLVVGRLGYDDMYVRRSNQ